jgi:hypothetical protein
MLRALSQRPSIAVGVCIVVVLSFFALRGDLPVETGRASRGPAAPVVVRTQAPPRPEVADVELRGRVFDALGFLVVGAEVLPLQGAAQRTDADGAFRVWTRREGVVDLLVRSGGCQPVWRRTSALTPDALVVQLTPAAPWDPAPGPLPAAPVLRGEGRVLDSVGRPLAGAFVGTAESGLWTRADDLGRYVLPLAQSTVHLLVTGTEPAGGGSGFALRGQPFVSSRETGAVPLPDLIAEAAATVRGVVRDPRGAPQEGVPVQLRGEGVSRLVETGGGGAFRISGLPAGSYELQPLAFRGAVGSASAVTLDAAAVDVELHLQAVDERRLRVVDERGVPLGLVHVASSIAGARRGVAQADATGFVAVPVAPATQFEVRAPETFAPLSVKEFRGDEQPAVLVVTQP